MKTTPNIFTFLFCIILFLSEAHAQTEKGTLLLGGSAGMSFDSREGPNYFNVFVSPRIGIFVANRLALGAGVPFSFTSTGDFESSSIGIGPFMRYYFGNGKVSPFLEARGSLNRFSSQYREINGGMATNTSTTRSGGLGVGLAYFITPAISLESMLSYDATRVGNRMGSNSTRGTLNLNIGFQIYLSRRQE